MVFPDKSTSPQLDILVLRPSYPLSLRRQKHYFSGGVVAAFECKLTLRRADIERAFETAALIKKKCRQHSWWVDGRNTPYGELVQLPIVGLLSHSHSWRSKWPSTPISNCIDDFYPQFADHPRELLDVVCVADAGTFAVLKDIDVGPGVPEDVIETLRELDLSEAISISYTIQDDYKIEDDNQKEGAGFSKRGRTLAALIFSLIKWMAWDDISLRPWAEHLEALDFWGSIYKPTYLPSSDVLPAAMLKKIRRSGLTEDRWSYWSRWVAV